MLVVERWGLTFDEFEEPIDYFHKAVAGRWMVWMLIFVHISAALYHHVKLRDNTLRKMLPLTKSK